MDNKPRGDEVTEFEVVELLRRMDPIAEVEEKTSPNAERMLQDILSGTHPAPRLHPSARQRRQRRILPFGIGLVGLSTAAFAWALTSQASDPLQVGCYAELDLGGDIVVLETDERGFVGVCAQAWERGDLGPFLEVPELAACVLDSGAVGVFPSRDNEPCGELGLLALSEESPPGEKAVIGLDDAVTEIFLAQTCVDPEEARQVVESALQERGLNDWRVIENTPYSEARACASVSIDPAAMTITLIPIPPQPDVER